MSLKALLSVEPETVAVNDGASTAAQLVLESPSVVRALLRSAVAALSLTVAAPSDQEIAPEQLAEAIRLAADGKAADRFLDAYVVQPRAGWGNGPLIGVFSTPFARVVRTALAARRQNAAFDVADISTELLAPELLIVAVSQKGWPDETMTATVQSVTLIRADPTNEVVTEPSRKTDLTPEDRTFYGIRGSEPGVVAHFPMSALTPGIAIRVTFDQTARGISGSATCRQCVVPIDLRRIR